MKTQPRANYEVEVVQREMERYLQKRNAGYYREEPMPLHGYADFVVHGRDNRILIECKRSCDSIRKAIAQVLFYRAQMGDDVIPVIVVPEGSITTEAKELCCRWKVALKTIRVMTIREWEFEKIFVDSDLGGNGHVKEMIS